MIGETDHSTYKPALSYHPLANLFPMIEGPERVAFRQSIRDKGLRVKIVMHEGMILDGRNRYRELLGLGLVEHGVDWQRSPYFRAFGTEESDGDDPLSFVLDLNLDRRHLNESQRASVAARMATMQRGERTDLKDGSSLGEAVEGISRAEAAERLNVSERSVNSAKAVQDKGAPELVDAVDQGVLAVSVAEKLLVLPVEEQKRLVTEETPAVIKNAAKKVQRNDKEQKLAAKQKALPNKRYGVIYEDPAWRFELRSRETGLDRSADNHYPTMTLEEIMALPVQDIAAPDCVLFMWATVPHLADALKVIAQRGFIYKSHYIWDKTPWDGDGQDNVIAGRQGNGFWSRVNHELLLIATRGAPTCPAPGDNAPSVYREVASAHSAKPEYYARMIEGYFPNLPKIELNARAPRDGWDVWGNESEAGEEGPADAAGATPSSPPTNTYLASLDSSPVSGLRFRSTPKGEPTVPDLVTPGTLVKTSYSTGPYIVVRVSGPHFYAPDRGAFNAGLSADEAAVATDRVFAHYSLIMAPEASFLEAPGRKSLKENSYINEVVAVGGRLLKLFGGNTDETIVAGFNADAAKLLGTSTEPPKVFADFTQADPCPERWPVVPAVEGVDDVTAITLMKAKIVWALMAGLPVSDGPVLRDLMAAGLIQRSGGKLELTQRGYADAERLGQAVTAATDAHGNVRIAGLVVENVDSAHTKENSVSSDYIAELQKIEHLRGQLHQSTAGSAMRAGYAERVSIDQLAEDLGHPKGTIKTWANRLKLTSIDRMHETQKRFGAEATEVAE